MCGIVSIISKRAAGFWAAEVELFEGLLVLDTLRGLDSTGVISIDNRRQVKMMKIASHPYHLFAVDEYKKWRGEAQANARILVGHNRKATQGSINSANAHPFHENNIVLVHNGTLRGDHKKDFAPTEVDSHALAVAFARDGAEATIPKINGAFALVWWDTEKNRLFAVRNDERPLAMVETEDFIVMLSEPWMALQLLNRKNIKVKDVQEILPGQLHEFKIGGEYDVSTIDVQQDYYTTTYPSTNQRGVVHVPSVNSPKPNSGTQGGGSSPNTNLTSGNSTTTSPSGTNVALFRPTTSNSQPPAGKVGAPATNDAPLELPLDSATHVTCEEFTKGQDILVKYYECKLSDNKFYYIIRGKVIEPGFPEVDVMTYMRNTEELTESLRAYMSQPVVAVVVKHTVSLCGRSLYVNGNKLATMLNTHDNRISGTEWDHVQTRCQCIKCSAPIYDEEREFTGVQRRPNNVLAVTCADCVEDTLKGEAKYEFNQNRLAAVQAYESKRITPPIGDDGGTQAPSSASLH